MKKMDDQKKSSNSFSIFGSLVKKPQKEETSESSKLFQQKWPTQHFHTTAPVQGQDASSQQRAGEMSTSYPSFGRKPRTNTSRYVFGESPASGSLFSQQTNKSNPSSLVQSASSSSSIQTAPNPFTKNVSGGLFSHALPSSTNAPKMPATNLFGGVTTDVTKLETTSSVPMQIFGATSSQSSFGNVSVSSRLSPYAQDSSSQLANIGKGVKENIFGTVESSILTTTDKVPIVQTEPVTQSLFGGLVPTLAPAKPMSLRSLFESPSSERQMVTSSQLPNTEDIDLITADQPHSKSSVSSQFPSDNQTPLIGEKETLITKSSVFQSISGSSENKLMPITDSSDVSIVSEMTKPSAGQEKSLAEVPKTLVTKEKSNVDYSKESTLGHMPNIFSKVDSSEASTVPKIPTFQDGTTKAPLFASVKSSIASTQPLTDLTTSVIVEPSSLQMKAKSSLVATKNKPNLNAEDRFQEIFGVKTDIQNEAKSKSKPTTLIAIDVPEKFLNKSVLTEHFNKFGKVSKVLVYDKLKKALIYFSDHRSAMEAKLKGKRLHPNLPEMILMYRAPVIKSKVDSSKKVTKSSDVERALSSKKVTKSSDVERALKKRSIMPQVELIPHAKHSNTRSLKAEAKLSSPSAKIRSSSPSTSININSSNMYVIMKSQAFSSLDKFRILEARDKALRAKQTKILDVNEAEYLAASCPDLCPEKERYMREVRGDVSVFEMSDGQLNHKLAVKKFSRSSADKDEPLPHELRPGTVLKMSMDFLICNIVDRSDEKYISTEVWYNYLWNRTRALRNDIMQQHLVDPSAVYVLEKCIRFHIHCSHHFCDESSDMFDPKMNGEHLLKSLQSLKELYHDMAEKGEYFKAESEFRAYEILLNMNDGDIIYKYQQFRQPVRNSTDVQFAVTCLHALHSNNYVKFFKLVQASSYLQACILHRYYKNVRIKAVHTILKGYSSTNKTQNLPKESMKKMLGICEDDELNEFLECFGLSLCPEGNFIHLDRNKFISDPDNSFNSRKDSSIDMKRNETISVIIQGGPLPTNPFLSHSTHESFTSKGYLTKEAFDASDQHIVINLPTKITPLKMSEDSLAKHVIMKVTKMYEIKVMFKYFHHWMDYVQTERKVKTFQRKHKAKMLRKMISLWREKVAEVTLMNKKADLYITQKYLKNWQLFTRKSLGIKALKTEVHSRLCRHLAKKFFLKWRSGVTQLKLNKRLATLRQKVIARKYYLEWRSYYLIRRSLNEAEQYHCYKLVESSFNKWRNWLLDKKNKMKSELEGFPAVGSQLSVKEQNNIWSWGYERHHSLNISALKAAELEADIVAKLWKHFILREIEENIAWRPLPFKDRFQEYIDKPQFSPNIYNHFLKVNIYVDGEVSNCHLRWVRIKFDLQHSRDSSALRQRTLDLHSKYTGVSFKIITREKNISSLNKSDCDGAMLFLILTTENQIEECKAHCSKLGRIPYLILCESSSISCKLETIWFVTKNDLNIPSTSAKLFETVIQFCMDYKKAHIMYSNKLGHLLTKYINKEILNPSLEVIEQRIAYGHGNYQPSIIIEFYNEAIDYLSNCLKYIELATSIEDVSPSEVFSVTNKLSSTNEALCVEQLRLPSLFIKPDITWGDLNALVTNYVNCVIGETAWGDNLRSEIHGILRKVESTYDVDTYPFNVPWFDVLSSCIFFQISQLPTVEVVYKPSTLEHFKPTQDYLLYLQIYEMESAPECPPAKLGKREAENEPPSLEEPLSKKIKSTFLDELALEKAEMEKLDKQLEDELILIEQDLNTLRELT